MEPGRRQHLQDIYATDRTQKDDYTPQVSSEILEERKRDIRRQQFTTFLLGTTITFIAVGLVVVIVKKYIDIMKVADAPEPITNEYIPRYSLAPEQQWVLDYTRDYSNPEWEGEGERPFSGLWLKKAAFNLILAEQAVQVREFGEAAEFYENVLEIMPNIEGVKVPLGMVYFRLNKFDKALALLADAPEADLTFDVLNNLGAACIDAKTYEKGEEYLKRSLELRPAYAEALKNLAILYEETEQHEKAAQAYEQYLDQRPDDTDTRHNFALYLVKNSNWERAAEQLRILTEEITKEAMLYQLLARVENKLGNYDASIAAFQRAAQLVDPKQALLWMNEQEFDQLRQRPEFRELMKLYEKKR